jgi:dynein heavy chain
VQPHLHKCFENIAKLEFQPDLTITSMYSGEDERIEFAKKVVPKGNVEHWLLEVESAMRKSLKQGNILLLILYLPILPVIKDGLTAYSTVERSQWVLDWPGQVVLTASQIMWTKEVSEAIQDKDGGLRKLYQQQLSQLDDLTKLVRGNLTPLARLTLGSLIVIDVHARDVVKNLIASGVSEEKDFEWMSQLKYYWDGEDVTARMVNASFKYGYEYLGNTARLVITPLTDRCYVTLTGNIVIYFLSEYFQGLFICNLEERHKDLLVLERLKQQRISQKPWQNNVLYSIVLKG